LDWKGCGDGSVIGVNAIMRHGPRAMGIVRHDADGGHGGQPRVFVPLRLVCNSIFEFQARKPIPVYEQRSNLNCR
jgi:hypothetical protein